MTPLAWTPSISGRPTSRTTVAPTSTPEPTATLEPTATPTPQSVRFDFTDKASRLSDNETMSWTWVGGAGSFDSFALRVNGVKYDSGATNTIWYGASLLAVPETATYALMLAGLGALGVVSRRRKTR